MLPELDFLEWRGVAVCAMRDRLTPLSEGMRVEASSILSECKCGLPRERSERRLLHAVVILSLVACCLCYLLRERGSF
jgi:hypothetical protein